MALGTDPNALLDLKQGSGQDVTVAQVRRMQAQAAQVEAAASGIAWKQLGPYNIGGRLTDVVADVDQPNTVYSAVAGGGVWRSSDGGANWTNVWPNSNTQPMGALEQAEDGTLWAGTGEANPPGGGLTYFGDGIYKSTDRGATWTNTGLRDSEAIGRIASDPTNSNRVFAAASGHIARSSGRARPLPHRGRRQDVGAGARAAERVDRRDRRRDPPDQPADRLRVAVGSPAHERPPHLRRRRLRPVPLDGRRRHVDAAREHRRRRWPALRPDADGPDVAREPRSHRHRDPPTRRAPARTTASTSSSATRPARTRASTPLTTTANPSPARGPLRPPDPNPECGRAYHAERRLPVVVRPDLRQPGELPAHLQHRRPAARVARRRQDVAGQRRRPGRRRQRARRPARHVLGHVDLDGDPATASRVFLGNDAGTYRSDNSGLNGSWVEGRRPAVEPGLQPGHLAAGRTAHDDGPAGQRQQPDVDRGSPDADRPGAHELGLPRRR